MIEQWQVYLNYHQRMGLLPLKKHVDCDKCSFATKQRMFGVFAIDEILCYQGTRFPGSRTLCHPVSHQVPRIGTELIGQLKKGKNNKDKCIPLYS